MRVIIMVDDQHATRLEPRAFASVAALDAAAKAEGWDGDEDHSLLLAALRKGKSFSDASHYFGWHEVEGASIGA
jgi:hypothetical protein